MNTTKQMDRLLHLYGTTMDRKKANRIWLQLLSLRAQQIIEQELGKK